MSVFTHLQKVPLESAINNAPTAGLFYFEALQCLDLRKSLGLRANSTHMDTRVLKALGIGCGKGGDDREGPCDYIASWYICAATRRRYDSKYYRPVAERT